MGATREQRGLFLESTPLFSGLRQDLLDRLIEMSTSRSLAANDTLCNKGDEAAQLYGVLSGRLKAVGTSSDGKEVVFTVMGPGELTGEIALLDAKPRSATIIAMEPCELVVINRREFLAFLRDHNDASLHLLSALAGYIRRLSGTVEDAYYHNLPTRLSKKLVALSRVHGEDTAKGRRITIKLSQQEIGELVGKTREAVNKQLRSWTEEGLLSMEKGFVTLHDVDALEDISGDYAL